MPIDKEGWVKTTRGGFCRRHWSWACAHPMMVGQCQREFLQVLSDLFVWGRG